MDFQFSHNRRFNEMRQILALALLRGCVWAFEGSKVPFLMRWLKSWSWLHVCILCWSWKWKINFNTYIIISQLPPVRFSSRIFNFALRHDCRRLVTNAQPLRCRVVVGFTTTWVAAVVLLRHAGDGVNYRRYEAALCHRVVSRRSCRRDGLKFDECLFNGWEGGWREPCSPRVDSTGVGCCWHSILKVENQKVVYNK